MVVSTVTIRSHVHAPCSARFPPHTLRFTNDAVTTEDTITQLRAAIRKMLAVLRQDYPVLAVAAKAACRRDDDYATPGRRPCDWDDREAKAVLSVSTLRETKSIVSHHLVPRLGSVPVGAVTTEQIDRVLTGLRRILSVGAVSRTRMVIHAALAQAVRWDWIWSNPATHAARFEVGPKAHHVPPVEVIQKVLDSLRASDPIMMLFVRLAATTGARRGEILALSWVDIDFANRRVRLVHGIVEGAGGPVRQERKTKNANCIDLDEDTIALLLEHHGRCRIAADARRLVVDQLPLFGKPSDMTRPWAPNWVTKKFAVALDYAGVAHFRLHDLRRFVATQMLAAGVALPVVSARLGHARVSTTLNVYAASMPAWDRAAAETLSSLLRAS